MGKFIAVFFGKAGWGTRTVGCYCISDIAGWMKLLLRMFTIIPREVYPEM